VLARYATGQVGGSPGFHSESHRVGHLYRFFGLCDGCVYQAGGGSQFHSQGSIRRRANPGIHDNRNASLLDDNLYL
jgi:hypothetical protein